MLDVYYQWLPKGFIEDYSRYVDFLVYAFICILAFKIIGRFFAYKTLSKKGKFLLYSFLLLLVFISDQMTKYLFTMKANYWLDRIKLEQVKQSPAFDAHLKLETSVKIRDLQHYCRSLALKNSNSRQSCTYYMDMNAITPELREEFKYQMKIGSLVPICRIVYRKEGSDTIKCDELEKMQNSFPRKNISD